MANTVLQNPQTREITAFLLVGGASTLCQLLLFSAFTTFTGAVAANALALFLTLFLNTSLNRRFTFRIKESTKVFKQHLQAVVGLVVSLVVTSLSVHITSALTDSKLLLLFGLSVGVLIALIIRFLLMKFWIFKK